VNTVKELGTINGLQTDEDALLLRYKVRVDKDAVDGENEINIKYAYGTGVVHYTKTFNVTISNPRTDFDVSVQELSKTIMSLVIDNIGENSAQSVIVKIPEQEGFEILGSSTYSIGEMKAGNHTTVSFPITPLKTQENLTVEIYYTDKIGVRRTVQKKLLITKSFIEDFDLIVQDSTSTSVTLAIANIGTDTAYSVIMKIPEQENFRVTGTSTSILGNLDAGDYTLASFQITSIKSAVNISAGLGGVPSTRNVTNISADREKNLIVEISYTDTLGIRRTVQKKVELNLISTTGEVTGTETMTWSTQRNQSQMSAGNGLIYIGVGVVGIIIIVVFLRFRKRKKK